MKIAITFDFSEEQRKDIAAHHGYPNTLATRQQLVRMIDMAVSASLTDAYYFRADKEEDAA